MDIPHVFLDYGFWWQFIIVYSLGVFAAYVSLKLWDWKQRKDNTWEDIQLRLVLSVIFSWVVVLLVLLGYLFKFLDWLYQRKPPSWL